MSSNSPRQRCSDRRASAHCAEAAKKTATTAGTGFELRTLLSLEQLKAHGVSPM